MNIQEKQKNLPGIGGTSFVITLKNTQFSQTPVSPIVETSIQTEVESVEEVRECGFWVPYDREAKDNREKIPCDKYLVQRKDGKIHFEDYNGTGWAYNDKVITHYSKIHPAT